MDVEDLWIGDRVEIVRSGRIGSFEGVNNGKVRVKVNNKILLVSAKGVKLAPELKLTVSEILNDGVNETSSLVEKRLSFFPEIDLHMESLQPSKQNETATSILEFQLRKLTEFLMKAIDLKIPKVSVIHGKGTGVLKMETLNIIEGFSEKQSIFPINAGGGVAVYFNYK